MLLKRFSNIKLLVPAIYPKLIGLDGFEMSIIATPFLAVTYAYPSIIDIQFGLGPPPPPPGPPKAAAPAAKAAAEA